MLCMEESHELTADVDGGGLILKISDVLPDALVPRFPIYVITTDYAECLQTIGSLVTLVVTLLNTLKCVIVALGKFFLVSITFTRSRL